MTGTQREKDILIMERELAFKIRLEDWFENYEDERGKRGEQWPEENEITQSELETPPPALPDSLA